MIKEGKQRGFTLLEIMVSIAIFGVLLLIAIPNIVNYRHNLELGGVVQNLMSDLRYAQQLAVTEQVEHSVYFIVSEKKYQVKRYGETVTVVKEVSLSTEIIDITILNLTEEGSEKEARYNSYGAVKDAGEIILTNSQNATTTIEVRPSGFVKKTN